MKPEAIKPDAKRSMALDALSGMSVPDIAIKYFDQGLAGSRGEVSDLVLAVFDAASPEIMRAYPERDDLSRFLSKLRKDTRRQLVLAIKTKTRGTR